MFGRTRTSKDQEFKKGREGDFPSKKHDSLSNQKEDGEIDSEGGEPTAPTSGGGGEKRSRKPLSEICAE